VGADSVNKRVAYLGLGLLRLFNVMIHCLLCERRVLCGQGLRFKQLNLLSMVLVSYRHHPIHFDCDPLLFHPFLVGGGLQLRHVQFVLVRFVIFGLGNRGCGIS
jgi:hypothetical protein